MHLAYRVPPKMPEWPHKANRDLTSPSSFGFEAIVAHTVVVLLRCLGHFLIYHFSFGVCEGVNITNDKQPSGAVIKKQSTIMLRLLVRARRRCSSTWQRGGGGGPGEETMGNEQVRYVLRTGVLSDTSLQHNPRLLSCYHDTSDDDHAQQIECANQVAQ